jgi:hypothetical protein
MLGKPSDLDLKHSPSSFGSRNVTIRRKEGAKSLSGSRGAAPSTQKSVLDVLNAARELVESEIKFTEARRDLVQASYASMGWLKAVALKAAATRLTGSCKPRSKRTILKKEPSAPDVFR